MMFSDPLTLTCARCAAESRHNPKDLLALTAACPACGAAFEEVGLRMGELLDESTAFAIWAEVLMGVEDRLGVAAPGIPDGEVLSSTRISALTLRDLVRLVSGYVLMRAGAEEAATQLVLDAARDVAHRRVPAADLDLPLIQALDIAHRVRQARDNRGS